MPKVVACTFFVHTTSILSMQIYKIVCKLASHSGGFAPPARDLTGSGGNLRDQVKGLSELQNSSAVTRDGTSADMRC
jgi:hypothetical protein